MELQLAVMMKFLSIRSGNRMVMLFLCSTTYRNQGLSTALLLTFLTCVTVAVSNCLFRCAIHGLLKTTGTRPTIDILKRGSLA